MSIDLHLRSRPIEPPSAEQVAGDAAVAAGVGAAGTGTVSYAFHRFGPPKLPNAGALRATAGTAIAVGVATGLIAATNGAGALHGGERSNSMLESTLVGTAAFGALGWHPLFHGRTVSNAAGAGFNMLLGAMVSPVIHQIVAPD